MMAPASGHLVVTSPTPSPSRPSDDTRWVTGTKIDVRGSAESPRYGAWRAACPAIAAAEHLTLVAEQPFTKSWIGCGDERESERREQRVRCLDVPLGGRHEDGFEAPAAAVADLGQPSVARYRRNQTTSIRDAAASILVTRSIRLLAFALAGAYLYCAILRNRRIWPSNSH